MQTLLHSPALQPLPELRGRHARLLTEEPREVVRIGEAQPLGNVAHRQPAIGKHRLGALQQLVLQESLRRHPYFATKYISEVARCKVELLGAPRHGGRPQPPRHLAPATPVAVEQRLQTAEEVGRVHGARIELALVEAAAEGEHLADA